MALEIKNDTECRINSVHLFEIEEPNTLAQPARVNGCDLLG